MQESSESLTEITQDDLHDNANILNEGVCGSVILLQFESAANKQEIPTDEYRQNVHQRISLSLIHELLPQMMFPTIQCMPYIFIKLIMSMLEMSLC